MERPKYIVDGIRWLAGSNELMTQDPVLAQAVEATTSIEEGASADVEIHSLRRSC